MPAANPATTVLRGYARPSAVPMPARAVRVDATAARRGSTHTARTSAPSVTDPASSVSASVAGRPQRTAAPGSRSRRRERGARERDTEQRGGDGGEHQREHAPGARGPTRVDPRPTGTRAAGARHRRSHRTSVGRRERPVRHAVGHVPSDVRGGSDVDPEGPAGADAGEHVPHKPPDGGSAVGSVGTPAGRRLSSSHATTPPITTSAAATASEDRAGDATLGGRRCRGGGRRRARRGRLARPDLGGGGRRGRHRRRGRRDPVRRRLRRGEPVLPLDRVPVRRRDAVDHRVLAGGELAGDRHAARCCRRGSAGRC